MLPLWRDEAHVLLTPSAVCVQRRARGLRLRAAQSHERTVDIHDGYDWSPALAVLDELLQDAPARGVETDVIVSSHFVRYGVVPASDLLVTHDDAVRYAQQNFARVYGPAAEAWSVRLCTDASGGVACGIEQDLVDRVRTMLVAHGMRPRLLIPMLMSVFNQARAALPPRCRLIVAEPGIAVCALLSGGWKQIRSQRMSTRTGAELMRVLDRERALDEEPFEPEVVRIAPLWPLEDVPTPQADTNLQILPALWSGTKSPARPTEAVT